MGMIPVTFRRIVIYPKLYIERKLITECGHCSFYLQFAPHIFVFDSLRLSELHRTVLNFASGLIFNFCLFQGISYFLSEISMDQQRILCNFV